MSTEQKTKRKLRAILSADVKGYSILMADDEVTTIQKLKDYRNIMSEYIEMRGGRVVDAVGDNLLAEFGSAVDAVQCAVDVQKELKKKNQELPEDKRLQFRVGINIGDVIQDGNRIFGDGVNIAARIEGLAEAGGVCISRNTYDQIRTKLNLGYEYLGEHTVKNISQPVRVYKVLMGPMDAGKLIGEEPRRTKKKWLLPAAVVAAIVVTSVAWYFIQNFMKPDIEPASIEKMAFPLPEKPSIAVLPFVNMSGDSEQEYIGDSITENIITALSYVPEMFVIARTSTYVYKGKPITIKQISEELGVRYVLEGSIQKVDDRIRVTAQLIDAISGHHLWADRYDKNIEEFFKVLDEIAKAVVIELQVKLTEGDVSRISHKTEDFEAWLSAITAYSFVKLSTKENVAKARKLFEKAIRLDPEYGFAWSGLGAAHNVEGIFGWGESRQKSFELAVEYIDKAIKLDENLSCATTLKGRLYRMQGKLEQAISTGKKAIALGPSHDLPYSILGNTMCYAGRYEESIALMEKSMRLNPYYPAWYLSILGKNYFFLERYGEAIDVWTRLLERAQKGEYPPLYAHKDLSAGYIQLGKYEEASAHAEQVYKINPKFFLEGYARNISQYKNKADYERYFESLRKVGYPDEPPLPLPDKPSIAVLPFTNMSDDQEQEYFSDGTTEDIITDLSKIKDLLVISRNSTFTYKGQNKKVPEIANELNVRYVLEGSVRRAGDQIRITAQLIDAKTDHHVWAERFDDTFQNIFELQDRITKKIVSAIALKLSPDEANRIASKGTDSTIAHDMYLKGQAHLRRYTPDDLVKAINYFKQAVEVDPDYSQAYVGLAQALDQSYVGGDTFFTKTSYYPEKSRYVMRNYIELAMKKPTPGAYSILATLEMRRRHYDKSINLAEKAVAFAPNDADALRTLGQILTYADRPKEAIKYLEEAIRLNPLEGHRDLAFAYMSMQKYEEALESAEHSLAIQPTFLDAHMYTAVSYSHLGREEEAKEAFKKYLPKKGVYILNMQELYFDYPFKNPETFNRFIDGLVKAGYEKDTEGYYEVNEANKMKGKEIKELLIGKTITGGRWKKGSYQQWSEQRREDGVLEYNKSIFAVPFIGEYQVEGDVLCERYENRFEGVKHCFDVYYNPKGNISGKDQYLKFGDYKIRPFSIGG